MDSLGMIDRNRTAFVMVDMQDRLISAMHDGALIVANANRLVESAKILGIPLIVTEQYPKGLGGTSGKIALPQDVAPIEKVSFSCFGSDDFNERLHHLKRDTLVIFGTEAHICVLKTALDARKAGFGTHVVADAVSSRKAIDCIAGIERMRQSGVFIATTEMVLFQLMDRAGSEEFRAVSALIKQ
ncbi:hydrolase [Candidatus Micrarchaeota archaeon]|nr:hydrolase [Candidatus Micrarchaeota archaeon]